MTASGRHTIRHSMKVSADNVFDKEGGPEVPRSDPSSLIVIDGVRFEKWEMKAGIHGRAGQMTK
jgi:hypothetical protein